MSIHETGYPYSREAAILVAAGLDSRNAAICIARAVATGAHPLEQAIADRLISEEAGYHALADFLDLPFAGGRIVASLETSWPEAELHGLAPLAPNTRGWRFAMAPRGRFLREALGWDARRPGRGLVITTPARLARAVEKACATQIQFAASHRLPDASPFDSARNGPGAPVMIAIVFATFGFLTLFYWSPALALACLSLAIGSLFLVTVALRLAAAASPGWPVSHEAPRLSDKKLPTYTVLVPLYREANMARRLTAWLCAIDYPPLGSNLTFRILAAPR
ncbi:hypothetical protein [Terrarubrum flagellatum]|uniref:hypothetical protein n=1 Tax=Terrirubrum flagellatum TaxID=2895980 RepID=UPI003144E6B3